MTSFLYKTKSAIFGGATGDALGVPVEFKSRAFLDENPVTEMTGFGTYNVPKGAWSDDTSMTLGTLDSLTNGVSYDDIAERFLRWENDGEYTPTGIVFDIGNTTSTALEKYKRGTPALLCGDTDEYSNGNGSLMRIMPAALYCKLKALPTAEAIEIIHNVSAVTHNHIRAKIACGIYSFIVWELIDNPSMESIDKGIAKAFSFYEGISDFKAELEHFGRLKSGEIKTTDISDIASSGYVVHSLEASVWCIYNTKSYEESVLCAVNLGADTDTTAMIAGGLAGLIYGYEAIPSEWLEALLKKDYIEMLCEKFSEKI